jgi:hypothetical protein
MAGRMSDIRARRTLFEWDWHSYHLRTQDIHLQMQFADSPQRAAEGECVALSDGDYLP